MIDDLLDFLEGPLQIDSLLPFVFGYVMFMWVLFASWVLRDSKKKFQNNYISIALFILVLPLNFPALVFYLIIRPEEENSLIHQISKAEESIGTAGMHIPIANFVSEKGIELSFQLAIANPELIKPKDRETEVEVSLKINGELADHLIKIPTEEVLEKKDDQNKNYTNLIDDLKNRLQKYFKKITKFLKKEVHLENSEDSLSLEKDKNLDKKESKKSRKKRKKKKK